MNILVMALTAVMGYLLGSINTSIVVSLSMGTDIRKHGSGNAGATNALRELGKKAAVFVLVGDMLKAVAAIFIARAAMMYFGSIPLDYIAALACVLGHNYPIYFGFRGGKGILTSFTAILILDYRIALIAFAVFLILFIITKYVSLGSIIAALTLPIAAWFMANDDYIFWFSVCVGLLAIYRHKANIVRLIKGEEKKTTFKKTK